MSASQHFASFAAYQPPPDDPAAPQSSSKPQTQRPWFPTHQSSMSGQATSYQAGGIPTFGASSSSGPSAYHGGVGHVDEAYNPSNLWETRFGWRVDACAAAAYLGGPSQVTALALLILETTNDYIRFHAYQSALVSCPMLLLIFLEYLILPSFFYIFTIIITGLGGLYLAFRAYQDASIGDLARFQVPVVGEYAERWVADE
ncbi:hypothetical protein BKA62DRAFT_697780 [Auriculariales sp. MPI-PUGE-AT-0066]|nr:hypothetical protein BKA62DRAFT_697780 [Auriculariales sp. MPI-PUGE-AT-0066]